MRITNKKLTDDPVLLRILDLLKEKGSTEKGYGKVSGNREWGIYALEI